MHCPRCGCALELDPEALYRDLPVLCDGCGAMIRPGELVLHWHTDPDDTELDHEGPYFWNR